MEPASGELRAKWDQRHGEAADIGEPAAVLAENAHLLPPAGRALDLACGRGANALFLSAAGLDVHAWDLSPVAIDRLGTEAAARGLTLTAEVRDVLAHPPPAARFDLIVVSYFLERGLAPALAGALRPGGLLFYETFAREAVTDCGPSNPAFRLADNELLRLFPGLRPRFYREEGRLGDLRRGHRDVAMLVAEQPL
ncbi:MAG: methyltransferase domain-containing protein [Chromatiales bacterium]